MGLFSFLSQLAHFGISSQVDSTRNRSKWSEGGSEWPSRKGVDFLKDQILLISLRIIFSFCRDSEKVIWLLISNLCKSSIKKSMKSLELTRIMDRPISHRQLCLWGRLHKRYDSTLIDTDFGMLDCTVNTVMDSDWIRLVGWAEDDAEDSSSEPWNDVLLGFKVVHKSILLQSDFVDKYWDVFLK